MNCKENIYLGSEILTNVDTFCYLEINVCKTGIDNKRNYERLLNIATQQYAKVQRWGFAYPLPVSKKKALIERSIRPCFEYGLSLLNPPSSQTNTIDKKLHIVIS
jgi:hypothetical protein